VVAGQAEGEIMNQTVVSNRLRRSVGIVALCSASLVASTAHAQTAPSDTTEQSPQAVGEEAQQNGEIIVTARRRAEALSTVPAAVTAFTAADLEARGVSQPGDFLDVTPGVFFRTNTTVGTSFINIRGVTQSRNAESPVAVVVDGVFLNNPLAFQNELVDIAQIEVLKGPQGALYGRNASAGAIIITTPAPTNDFRGYIGGGFGRHQSYKAEVSASGPIIRDKLLFRVTGYAHGTDGYLKNYFLSTPNNPYYMDAQHDVGGRVRLLWNASDDFQADLRYSHSETRGGFNNDVSDVTGAFPLSDYASPRIIKGIPYTANVRGFDNRNTDDASLKLDWTTPVGVITSVTAYSDLRDAGGGDSLPYKSTPADGTQFLVNNFETISQELRLTSPEDQRFRYIFGAYYQHTDRLFSSDSGTDLGQGIVIIDPTGKLNGPTSQNPASGGILATSVNQNAYAVFGSLAYDITDRIELSAALRYDRDKETATNDGPFNAGFAPNPRRGNKRNLTFSKLQPKFTLRYKTDTGNIYLTYAQGFKNGGFNPEGARAAALMTNPNTPIQDDFKSETTTTLEGGIKGTLADNRVSYGLSGYYNRIKGANYFDFIVAAATQIILNIDKVEVYGIEAEISARPTRTLTVAGSISYADNKIKKFSFDPTSVGKTSPFFPDIQASVSASWQDHIADNLQATARIDYQHVGRIYWDLKEVARRPALDFIDARVGLIYDDDSPLRVDLYCRNCTNRDYVNEALILSQIGLAVAFPVRNAREFGVEFSKRF
jgi:iron complex outermembrane receptor protein